MPISPIAREGGGGFVCATPGSADGRMNTINDDHQGRLSIGQVAAATGVSRSTLRHWEHEFRDFLETAKGADEDSRRFAPDAIQKIDHIKMLVKEQGLTLRGVRLQLEKISSSGTGLSPPEPEDPMRRKAQDLADRVTDRLLMKIFNS